MRRLLGQLPCPTVAIPTVAAGPGNGSAEGPSLSTRASAFDLCLASEGDLGVLEAAVRAQPIAALALVQLLRLEAFRRSDSEALSLESLTYGCLQGWRCLPRLAGEATGRGGSRRRSGPAGPARTQRRRASDPTQPAPQTQRPFGSDAGRPLGGADPGGYRQDAHERRALRSRAILLLRGRSRRVWAAVGPGPRARGAFDATPGSRTLALPGGPHGLRSRCLRGSRRRARRLCASLGRDSGQLLSTPGARTRPGAGSRRNGESPQTDRATAHRLARPHGAQDRRPNRPCVGLGRRARRRASAPVRLTSSRGSTVNAAMNAATYPDATSSPGERHGSPDPGGLVRSEMARGPVQIPYRTNAGLGD